MTGRLLACVPAAALIAVASSVQAAPFAAGNLVVLQVGDGTPIANNDQPQTVVLKEFSLVPESPPVQSLTMPTIAAPPNHRLTIPRSAHRHGVLKRTTNGLYLLLGGYDAAPGEDPVPGKPLPYASNADVVNRVVGRVDATGNIDTTTALVDAYNGDQGFHGAASEDGINIYLAGRAPNSLTNPAMDSGAVRYTTLGSTTSIRLGQATPGNGNLLQPRVVNISNHVLYASYSYSGNRGVRTFGGLPTTAGGADPTRVDSILIYQNQNSCYDFFFVHNDGPWQNGDIAYMHTDDDVNNTTSSGGVNRYEYSAETGKWVFKYVLSNGLPAFCGINPANAVRAMTWRLNSEGKVEIYVITAEDQRGCSPNRVMMITDTGCHTGAEPGCTHKDTFVTLQIAPENTTFRGIDWTPRACEGTGCLGACCHAGQTCSNTTQQDCPASDRWLGLDSSCETRTCPVVCRDPFADTDGDHDVDMDDFAVFQNCYTGPGQQLAASDPCNCMDRGEPGGDKDVDLDDFQAFLNCATGPALPLNPTCDG